MKTLQLDTTEELICFTGLDLRNIINAAEPAFREHCHGKTLKIRGEGLTQKELHDIKVYFMGVAAEEAAIKHMEIINWKP